MLNCVLDFPETAVAFWNIPVSEHTHPGMYPLLLICICSLVTGVQQLTNWTDRWPYEDVLMAKQNTPQSHLLKQTEGKSADGFSGDLLCVSSLGSDCPSCLFLRQQRLSQLTRSTVSAQLSHPQFPSLSRLSYLFPFIPTLAFIHPRILESFIGVYLKPCGLALTRDFNSEEQ